MLLAIDVGNSNVVFGLFEGTKLVKQWRCETKKLKIPLIKSKIATIVVASVVPSIDRKLKIQLIKRFNTKPYFVSAKNVKGIKVRLRDLNEVGADRVMDALAAYKLYGGPVIVVDFGTGTTFNVVSARGEYLGGAIAPGILMSRDALYYKTAKLPRIKLEKPKRLIGNDTLSAMQSGLVYGYAAMVEGMVRKLKDQISKRKSPHPCLPAGKGEGLWSKIKVIATGGLAPLVCKYTTVVDRIDTELTLKGLRIIADDLEI